MSAPTVQPIFARKLLARTISSFYIRPQPFGIADGDQFDPRSLYQNNEQGIWLDPYDMSTMFQDSAGTTPVTALGQPVGLALDKRLGLVIGPELVTNGDFSGGATGWSVTGNDATHIATFSGGTLRYQSDTTSPVLNVSKSNLLAANKTFLVTAVCSAWTSGSVKIAETPLGALIVNGVGTFTGRVSTVSVTSLGIQRNSANVDLTLDSISIREIAGNHAYQTTAASRPTLEARVNLLTNTGFTGGGAAPTNYLQPIATGTSAPSGTAANGGTIYTQAASAQRPLFASTVSYPLEANTSRVVTMQITAASGLIASDVLRWAIQPAGSTLSWPVCTANPSGGASGGLTAGALTMVISVGATAGSSQLYFGAGCLGNATGSVSFHSPQLEYGITPTAYQRVNTATDYVDVGAPRYLNFDGTDDRMQFVTASATSLSGNAHTVILGVKLVGALPVTTQTYLSRGVADWYVGTSTDKKWITSHSSAVPLQKAIAHGPVLPDGGVFVTSFRWQTSGSNVTVGVRSNTVQQTPAVAMPLTDGYGAATGATWQIAAFAPTGAPFPANRLYGLIVRNAYTSDALTAAAEQWMNSKTRAY